MGTPSPAAFNTSMFGPRPAQQSASRPSITTAGTDWIPRLFARADTAGSFISRTDTSQDVHAFCLIISMVSRHTGQPALKISILRTVFIRIVPSFILWIKLFQYGALANRSFARAFFLHSTERISNLGQLVQFLVNIVQFFRHTGSHFRTCRFGRNPQI